MSECQTSIHFTEGWIFWGRYSDILKIPLKQLLQVLAIWLNNPPEIKSSFLLTRYTVEKVPSPIGFTTFKEGNGAGNSDKRPWRRTLQRKENRMNSEDLNNWPVQFSMVDFCLVAEWSINWIAFEKRISFYNTGHLKK